MSISCFFVKEAAKHSEKPIRGIALGVFLALLTACGDPIALTPEPDDGVPPLPKGPICGIPTSRHAQVITCRDQALSIAHCQLLTSRELHHLPQDPLDDENAMVGKALQRLATFAPHLAKLSKERFAKWQGNFSLVSAATKTTLTIDPEIKDTGLKERAKSCQIVNIVQSDNSSGVLNFYEPLWQEIPPLEKAFIILRELLAMDITGWENVKGQRGYSAAIRSAYLMSTLSNQHSVREYYTYMGERGLVNWFPIKISHNEQTQYGIFQSLHFLPTSIQGVNYQEHRISWNGTATMTALSPINGSLNFSRATNLVKDMEIKELTIPFWGGMRLRGDMELSFDNGILTTAWVRSPVQFDFNTKPAHIPEGMSCLVGAMSFHANGQLASCRVPALSFYKTGTTTEQITVPHGSLAKLSPEGFLVDVE